jgi:glutamate formiminotransferase/formiminotetrahydrofolate cyclodeaminase
VPLTVLQKSVEALELAQRVARDGNPASVSDAGVAGACALAAAEGAALNVLINVPSLTDTRAAGEILASQKKELERARAGAQQVLTTVQEILRRA